VRRVALLTIAPVLALAAHRADARPNDDASRDSFWRDVVEPHHAEVDALVAQVRAALSDLDSSELSDVTPPPSARIELARDLVGVLAYAHRLEPDNLDVLHMLADAADDAGDAARAHDALAAIVKLAGEEHAGADALDRLGAAAIDTGKLDEAIRVLRIAQGPVLGGVPATAHVLVHLSTALALAGRSGDAIDVLAVAQPSSNMFELSEAALVELALAVQYDREEQRGAAFDVLERMKVALGDQLAPVLQNALAKMRFAPAEDERYYRALMDEVVGDLPEARTEWLLYAADEGAPYRRRALDHARAIDAMPPARKQPSLPQLTVPPPNPGAIP
jgi:tetratricopeptide (TPR) repeat protein